MSEDNKCMQYIRFIHFQVEQTYWIVVGVDGLSEGLRVLAVEDVVDQTLALPLPGVPVWQHLQRALGERERRA